MSRKNQLFNINLATILFCLFCANANGEISKIVGGNETTIEKHPWMAGLVVRGQSSEDGVFCGGALIASNIVMTAAHCVEDANLDTLEVQLGIADLKKESSGNRIAVTAVIINPNFLSAEIDGDIALLILASNASQTVLATATKAQKDAFGGGTAALVAGWGNLSKDPGTSDFPTVLHDVELVVEDFATCNATWDGELSDNHLCAKSPNTEDRDSCNGDSGGPLTAVVDGKTVAIGIVSFGESCANKERAGVYTRVSQYEDFIKDVQKRQVSIDQSVKFGFVLEGTSATGTVTLKNFSADDSFSISQSAISDSNITITSNSCANRTLTPGQSCAFELQWNPTKQELLDQKLTMTVSDGANTSFALQSLLLGTGLGKTTFGSALDIPNTTVYVGGDVSFQIDSSDQFKGGQSLKTGILSREKTAVIAIVLDKIDLVEFYYKGNNSLIGVGNLANPIDGVTPSNTWRRKSNTSNDQTSWVWVFTSDDGEDGFGQIDAIKLTEAAPPPPPTPPAPPPRSSGGGGSMGWFASILISFGFMLYARTKRSRQFDVKQSRH